MINNLIITNEDMHRVEKMFISYIQKSIIGTKLDYYKKIMKVHRTEISIEIVPLPSKAVISCFDLSPFQNPNHQNDSLHMALDKLPDKDTFVLERIYADGYTEREVGAMLGVPQQSVHRYKKLALEKLKSAITKAKNDESLLIYSSIGVSDDGK